ncbi:MAG TPA: sigma-E factor regulatory protein RseB domain-containing protein, partial [Candidatus Nitrosotenuis sp.]|nr:sigma-E factor regulatory protein RseB domain-containing protein [Candidatus Nitrosotenuis sp.]
MRRLAWALLAVLLYLPAAARAQESPAQILERLLSPPAYEGERAVMIWSAGEMGAVELLESCSGPGADRRLRLERRASPGLAPVVLVDGPREIVAWHAQEHQAHSWLRSDLSRARLRRALSSYSWSIAGQDDLSGYRCLVVEARPTYAGGLVSRFWIERSHQVVLRREKYTPEGQLVYLSAFTDIDFLEQDPEEFQSPPARAAGSLSAAG